LGLDPNTSAYGIKSHGPYRVTVGEGTAQEGFVKLRLFEISGSQVGML
jgi:hypothetical protein